MARNKGTGEGISIPLHFELKTDEALKDLEKFANQVKADISGFSAAKRILDGFEKSLNSAFNGKNVDNFSGKLLKLQENASKSAKELIGMSDKFKEVFERQQLRDGWSSPEKRQELTTALEEALAARKALLEESSQISQSGALKGIGDPEYYQRMVDGANAARARLQELNAEKTKLEQDGGKGTDEWKRIKDAMTSAKRSMNGYEVQKKRAMDPAVEQAARARWNEIDEELKNTNAQIKQFTEIQRALQSEATDMPIIEQFQRLTAMIKAADLQIQNFGKDQEKAGAEGSGNLGMARGFYLLRTIMRDVSKASDTLRAKINQFTGSIANAAKKMFHLNKESQKTTRTLKDGFKQALNTVVRYGFGIRSLFFLFRRLRTYAKEALDEMAKTFPDVNRDMTRAANAVNQLKGALGTLVQPLLHTLIPILEKVSAAIMKIINLVASLFALMSGQKTIKVAIATTTDYAESIEGTGKNAKKAKKELEGYLSPIDEINKYKKDSKDDEDGSKGKNGGPGYKFIEQSIDPIASKLKDLLEKILGPIKKAWAEVGPLVVASWKRALKEIKGLLTDIGRDMLEVWNQPETLDMLKNILYIIADIGDIIYNLAHNFREAWNEAETGKKILEAIRDIFAIIVQHIKNMADATVTWSKNLNFKPLLSTLQKYLESLKPVVDALMGVLEDFYIKVLLPLSKWAIEKGLPQLLQVFIDFNKKVDWEGLRSRLATFWEHLEPFAERVGEGLILFIGDLTDKLADFLNSDAIDTILTKIEEFIDNITAEDIESILWGIVNALIAMKVATTVASGLSKFIVAIKDISMIIKNWESISKAVSVIGSVAQYIAGIGLVITGLVISAKAFFDMWNEGWSASKTILEAVALLLAVIGAIILGAPVVVAAVVAAIIFVITQIVIVIHDNWDAIKQFFVDLWTAIVDGWNGFVDWLKGLWDGVVQFFSDCVTAIGNFFVGLWDGIVKIYTTVVNWFKTNVIDPLIKVFETFKKGISKIFEGLWIIIKAIWIVVSTWFDENVITPLHKLWDTLCTTVKGFWESVVTTVKGWWLAFVTWLNDTIIQPVQTLWNNLCSAIQGFWDSIISTIKGWWDLFVTWLDTTIIQPVQKLWEDLCGAVKGFWDTLVGDIKELWNEGYTWLKDNIIDPLQNAFDLVCQAISDFFSDLWDDIVDGAKAAVNGVISAFENAVNGIIDGVNGFLDLFNTAVEWAADITGEDWSGIELISHISLPRLAQGAVIPPNKEFMAVLGDQKSGTNIETPLATMVEAFNQALRNNDVGGVKQINFLLPDRRTLAQYTIAGGRIIQTSTGKNPFELA